MKQNRAVFYNGKRTAVRLEAEFWEVIDHIARNSIFENGNKWAENQLAKKPKNVGMSSWLRVSALRFVVGSQGCQVNDKIV